MNETVKSGANHAVNYGAGIGLAMLLVKLAARFGVTISVDEAMALAGLCTWAWHRVRPLVDAIFGRVLKAVSP